MMLQAERIYILMIKVKKLFPFLPQCFLKEIENMFSMFLSSYDDTLVKVWENLKKLWKHSPMAHVPTAFLILPNFHSCFHKVLNRNTIQPCFLFLNVRLIIHVCLNIEWNKKLTSCNTM